MESETNNNTLSGQQAENSGGNAQGISHEDIYDLLYNDNWSDRVKQLWLRGRSPEQQQQSTTAGATNQQQTFVDRQQLYDLLYIENWSDRAKHLWEQNKPSDDTMGWYSFPSAGAQGRGYWEDPSVLFRYNSIIESGGEVPEWVNEGTIQGAYQYLQWLNEGKDWTEWTMPDADAPLSLMLRDLPVPPKEFLLDTEMDWAGAAGETWREYLGQTGFGAAGQEGQGTSVHQPPAFDREAGYHDYSTEPEPEQVAHWKDMDFWQRAYMTLFSPDSNFSDRPEISRLAASVVSGLMSGVGIGLTTAAVATPVAGLAAGLAVTAASAYQTYTGKYIPGFTEALQLLDMGERGAKIALGVPVQMVEDGVTDVWEDLPAAMMASDAVYASSGVDMVNAVAKPGAYLETLIESLNEGADWETAVAAAVKAGEDAVAQSGEVWRLTEGYTEPVKITDETGAVKTDNIYGGGAMGELREDIGDVSFGEALLWLGLEKTPEDAAMAIADTMELYGDTGEFTDLIGSMVFDLGGLEGQIESHIGETVANSQGNTRLAAEIKEGRGNILADIAPAGVDVLLKAVGLEKTTDMMEILNDHRNNLRNGIWPDGTKPVDADGNVYTPAANELDLLDRVIGGVNKDGQIIEYLSPNETSNPLQKGIQYLRQLRPESKAALLTNNLRNSLNALVEQVDDVRLSDSERAAAMVDRLEDLAGVNLFAVGSAAEGIANSPVMATAAGLYQQALQTGGVREMLIQFRADEKHLDMLNQLAKAMEVTPERLVKEVASDPRGAFERVKQVIQHKAEAGSTGAKRLLTDIQQKRLTGTSFLDQLSKFVGYDSNGQVEVHPYSFAEWQANTMNKLFEAMENKLIEHYKVKPAAGIIRWNDAVRAGRALLTHDLSPVHLVSTLVNDWVAMGFDGVLGTFKRSEMDAFVDALGVRPAGLDSVQHSDIGLVDVSSDTAQEYQPLLRIMQAAQGDGAAVKVKQALQQMRKRFGIFGALVNRMETVEGERAAVMGMKKAWDQYWKEGRGFAKMPDALAKALSAVDENLPDHIYNVVRDAKNMEQVYGQLLNGNQQVTVNAWLEEAAEALNPAQPQMLVELISALGLDETLRDLLRPKDGEPVTAQDVRRAFRTVRREISDHLSTERLHRSLGWAAETAQRVQLEGFPAAADILTDLSLAQAQLHQDSLLQMTELVSLLETDDGSAARAEFEAFRRKFSDEYGQYAESAAAAMAGIFSVWGIEESGRLQILQHMNEIQRGWQDAYTGVERVVESGARATAQDIADWDVPVVHEDGVFDLLRRFFHTDLQGEARAALWESTRSQIDELFANAWQHEVDTQQKIDAASAGLWESYNQTGLQAQSWAERLRLGREKLHDSAQAFHDRMVSEGLSGADLQAAKHTFLTEEYQPLLLEVDKVRAMGFDAESDMLNDLTPPLQTEMSEAEWVQAVLSAQAVEAEARRVETQNQARYAGQLDRQQVLAAMEEAYSLDAREAEAMRVLMDTAAEAWAEGQDTRMPDEWWSDIAPEILEGKQGAAPFDGQDSQAVLRARGKHPPA